MSFRLFGGICIFQIVFFQNMVYFYKYFIIIFLQTYFLYFPVNLEDVAIHRSRKIKNR